MVIPHFGHNDEINYFTNLLLSCVHVGYLWLDCAINFTPQLIKEIDDLPLSGDDPRPLFEGKSKTVEVDLFYKYDMTRGKWGFVVQHINDPSVLFAIQVLTYKLLRKFQKEEVSIGVILAPTKCLLGVQMNSTTFLLNQFLEDYHDVKEKGVKFHYS